jgi:hypothetical protein
LGQDLLNAAFWMDIRKLENAERNFGPAPTAVLQEFRKVVPFRKAADAAPAAATPDESASRFLTVNAPESFYSTTAIAMPGGTEPAIPRAEPSKAGRK